MPDDPTPDGLLEQEFAEPYRLWKADPSPANASTVLKAVDPVVRSALRTYAGQAEVNPNVRSRARQIVLDSLPRYDQKRAKLRTHLMVNLQALRRAAAESDQMIAVPELVRLHSYKLHTAEQELGDRLGRAPSDDELAAHTGLSLKRLAHVRKAKPGLAEGQTLSTTEDGDEVSSGPAVVSRDRGNDAWLRFIYLDLDPVDKVIMEGVLGLHGKPIIPKGEIARRVGLSAGAISQRAARIQRLIDSREAIAGNLF